MANHLSIEDRLSNMEALLEKLVDQQLATKEEQLSTGDLLTAQQAATYLGLRVSTIYSYTHSRKIPFLKPGGKYLYFSKSALDEWVKQHNPLLMTPKHTGVAGIIARLSA